MATDSWPRAARKPCHAPAILGWEAGVRVPSWGPLPGSPLRAAGKMPHALNPSSSAWGSLDPWWPQDRSRGKRPFSVEVMGSGVEPRKAGFGSPVPSLAGAPLRGTQQKVDTTEQGDWGRGSPSSSGGPRRTQSCQSPLPPDFSCREEPSLGESTAAFLASAPKQGVLRISLLFAARGLCTQHCIEILYT